MINVSSFAPAGNEKRYVLECLESGRLTQGATVERFESAFAEMCGVRFAVACNSGTSALHLALIGAGIGQGDAVVVPALTYIATANAATYCGARVFFCDVDPETWCLDPESCRAAIYRARLAVSGRVAVIPVHLYNATAPVERIDGADLVIEDAAHAPGATRKRLRVGSLGIAAAFSFYASKVIATGEGGMMVTDDPEDAREARLYRGQGATVRGAYRHEVVGYNYRMTEIQAAIGLAQLEGLGENLDARRRLCELYGHLTTPMQERGLIHAQTGEPASGWLFAVTLAARFDRSAVADALSKRGIETRPLFEPLPSLPPYRSDGELVLCPVAVDVARRGICLPTHVGMETQNVHEVVSALSEVLHGASA